MRLNNTWLVLIATALGITASCSKEAFQAEIKEVSLLVEPFRKTQDPVTSARSAELVEILNDLYACYFAEGEGDLVQAKEESLQLIRLNIKEWRSKEDSMPATGYVVPMTYFGLAWRPDTLKTLLLEYSEDQELIGFIAESALFVWNTSSAAGDTFYCTCVWSELKGVSEMDWRRKFKPSVKPLLYRLLFEIDEFSGFFAVMSKEDILEMTYASSEEEAASSYVAMAKKCTDWIELSQKGEGPTVEEILGSTSGTFLQPVAESSVRYFRHFPE